MVVEPFLVVQKQGSNVACNTRSVAHSDKERMENKSVLAMCTKYICTVCLESRVRLGYGRVQ